MDNLHPFVPVHCSGEHPPQAQGAVHGGLIVCYRGLAQFGTVQLLCYKWLREEGCWGCLLHVEPSDTAKSFQTLRKETAFQLKHLQNKPTQAMHCCFTFSVVRTYTSGFELYQDKKPNTNKVSMGSSSGGNQTPRCGRKKKRTS